MGIRLSNNIVIPMIGIGPASPVYGKSRPRSRVEIIDKILNKVYAIVYLSLVVYPRYERGVIKALRMGYRLIDNSASYSNEKLIGSAIRKSGVPREEIFLTSRISNFQQTTGEVEHSFEKSLKELGVDYIDLYMFHWPVTGFYLETWKKIENLYKQGRVKAIGVANCNQHHLEEILKIAEIKPHVNQIEVHPLFTQKNLIEFCVKNGIQVESYTPIARNDDRLIRLPKLHQIAGKYNRTVQQIVLRWHIQHGLVPITRSSNFTRQLQNISIFDFELTQNEMLAIDNVNINSRLRYDPDNCDFSIL